MGGRPTVSLQWVAPTQRQAGWRLHLRRVDRNRPICGAPLTTGEDVVSVAGEPDPAICYGCYVEGRNRRGEILSLLAVEELGILEVESGCSHGPETALFVVASERAGRQYFLDRDCGCSCTMCVARWNAPPDSKPL